MPAGRPTKLTPEIRDEICTFVQAGVYLETAVAIVGIWKQTVHDWMRRANKELDRLEKNPRSRVKKKELPFIEFLDAYKRAQAASILADNQIITKDGSWQSRAWRLERKRPDLYGRARNPEKVEVEHGGKVPPVNITIAAPMMPYDVVDDSGGEEDGEDE